MQEEWYRAMVSLFLVLRVVAKPCISWERREKHVFICGPEYRKIIGTTNHRFMQHMAGEMYRWWGQGCHRYIQYALHCNMERIACTDEFHFPSADAPFLPSCSTISA